MEEGSFGGSGGGGGGSGTVTSVGLALPNVFSVAGSPVTTAGTITATLASQAQNAVFAAPSGGAGTPTFRGLVAGDIPALPYVSSSASQTANTVLAAPNGSAGAPAFRALAAADIPALAYVTSVGVSLPNIFSIAGSPVTTSGTITATLANQTANTVFAAPNGSTGAPSFRALVAADLPAGATSGCTLIQTQTPAAAANVTFSAIPGTYKHLLIVGRLEPSAGGVALNLTLNGDATANYAWSNWVTASTTGVSASLIQISNTMGGAGGGCEFEMVIPEYATARTSAGIRGGIVNHNANVTGAPGIGMFGGNWIGNAAITSVTLTPVSGTVTGTVSLYGFN